MDKNLFQVKESLRNRINIPDFQNINPVPCLSPVIHQNDQHDAAIQLRDGREILCSDEHRDPDRQCDHAND